MIHRFALSTLAIAVIAVVAPISFAQDDGPDAGTCLMVFNSMDNADMTAAAEAKFVAELKAGGMPDSEIPMQVESLKSVKIEGETDAATVAACTALVGG